MLLYMLMLFNMLRGVNMERLTVRKHGIVLFQKDGQYIPPMNMSGQEIRQALEWLADLEDALEAGVLKLGNKES